MLKRFRYRAYLTRPDQEIALNKTFGCARVVYNDVIHAREEAHKAGLPFPKAGDLSKQLITLAKLSPERAWLGEVSAVVLQQALGSELTGRRRACGDSKRLWRRHQTDARVSRLR